MVVIYHIYEKSVTWTISTVGSFRTLSKAWHKIQKIIYGEDSERLPSICYMFLACLRGKKKMVFLYVKNNNKLKEQNQTKQHQKPWWKGNVCNDFFFLCFSFRGSCSLLLINFFFSGITFYVCFLTNPLSLTYLEEIPLI